MIARPKRRKKIKNRPESSNNCLPVNFLWQKNHFEVAKCFKWNPDILITTPDKGAGVVILNRTDYITKKAIIFNNTTKFQRISDLSFDDTHKWEIKI